MFYSEVCTAVENLKKKYCESDPLCLCRCMGIKLIPLPFGSGTNAMKGFYLEKKRIKMITVNSDLPEVIQRIIIAHELGHAALHCTSKLYAFHEVGLFEESSDMEKDANFFAAELLLDDQETLDTLNSDGTFFTAAAALYVPVELLDFKFRLLKWKGYKLAESPIMAQNNFLKDFEAPMNADYQ